MGKRIIGMTQTGDFKKTDRFLSNLVGFHFDRKLKLYGERGVQALKAATPKDTGATADAWYYEIEKQPGRTAIYWCNDHAPNGVRVAILIQHGHATRNGGFVEGIDYINPAIRPIFEEMAREAWKEVVQ